MYNNRSCIGIIPARGGSKGLPGKNIRPLCGKPLIAWSIEAGLQSQFIDHVMVTTDDPEIAAVAQRFGAAVPFLRPKELADDRSPTVDAIKHALDFYRKHEHREFDYITLLEPTSPLRETKDIDDCIRTLITRNDAKSIVSVAKLESGHPEFNIVIEKPAGFIRKIDGSANFMAIRRQDLKDVYFFDGTIYCSEINSYLLKKTFYHDTTLAYPVPKWKSIEIDDLSDFICAEALLKAKQAGLLI